MFIIKKIIKSIFRYLSYGLFRLIYGKIKGKITNAEHFLETKNAKVAFCNCGTQELPLAERALGVVSREKQTDMEVCKV